ncbi:hypothetical protein CAL26_09840 [Bordetella genomosp. 9]|uniref:Uncharacterized protein n=1 Tax=Bordetella genomosp. 9 TaxID=1416803 RepID=A0A261RHD1_9BORD|nr:hypothetical protein [Bordetella genomosp. 9]OZI23723.1 hypothetical protein CAL26_09840 [Bordetella genomosp. 9]
MQLDIHKTPPAPVTLVIGQDEPEAEYMARLYQAGGISLREAQERARAHALLRDINRLDAGDTRALRAILRRLATGV